MFSEDHTLATMSALLEFNSCTLSKEEEDEMKRFFTLYDVDENGMLELDELQKMFANFNVIALKEDIKAFFERVSIRYNLLLSLDYHDYSKTRQICFGSTSFKHLVTRW